MNGRILDRDEQGFTIGVDQSFGNCPQYIQSRAAQFVSDPLPILEASVRVEGPCLSAEATALVGAADTFFIATASPAAGSENPVEGVDVSHRGGRPGFVDLR
jgi:predicted pyridoxine 5'-phosphate oxidase superfamily flavin-nucleotide-binding protein